MPRSGYGESVPLPGFEYPIQDTVLRPPVHPGVDDVPRAEPFRQATSLAAVFGHIANGIEYLPIREIDVSQRLRAMRSDGVSVSSTGGVLPLVPIRSDGDQVYHHPVDNVLTGPKIASENCS